MNILFWTDGFWPRIGGIETQGLQLIEGLEKKGHRCRIIAQKDSTVQPEISTSIERFDFNSIFAFQKLTILRQIEEYLERLLHEFSIDVIHLNACVGWHALVFLIFRKRLPFPMILTIHAPIFYQTEQNPLLARAISEAKLVGCVSKWVIEETVRLIPTAKEKLRLVYNGLESPQQRSTPLSFSPPTLLIAGRFTREKGFDTAIRAFALLPGSKIRLIAVGHGEEALSLQKLARELNVEERILFTGSVQREEVSGWINQATIVLVPSYFESFGLVAVEAMQMGRPVIASAVGGLQEIVSHEKTGLLVPPQNPISLANAVIHLLQSPEKAVKMGQEGAKVALEKFSLKQHIDQYEGLYRAMR